MSGGAFDPKPMQDALPTFDLPTLPRLFDRISDTLLKRGQLGLLSITVIQRGSPEQSAGWKGYEAIVGEISAFLDRLAACRRETTSPQAGLMVNWFPA